jgi:hypothetical protein
MLFINQADKIVEQIVINNTNGNDSNIDKIILSFWVWDLFNPSLHALERIKQVNIHRLHVLETIQKIRDIRSEHSKIQQNPTYLLVTKIYLYEKSESKLYLVLKFCICPFCGNYREEDNLTTCTSKNAKCKCNKSTRVLQYCKMDWLFNKVS